MPLDCVAGMVLDEGRLCQGATHAASPFSLVVHLSAGMYCVLCGLLTRCTHSQTWQPTPAVHTHKNTTQVISTREFCHIGVFLPKIVKLGNINI